MPVAEAYTIPEPVPAPIEISITERETKPDRPLESNVMCNCWAYVKQKYFANLPSTTFIHANLTQTISDVAVFYYPSSGVYHYAKVLSNDGFSFTIDEANYHRCQETQRTLTLDYPRLIGFYNM